MIGFKLICPECGAEIITMHPDGVVWERCPECRVHIWDSYDLLMAEVIVEKQQVAGERASAAMRPHSN